MKKALSAALAGVFLAAVLGVPAFARCSEPEVSAAMDLLIKSELETALSMLQAVFSRHQRGEMTLEKAKELGAGLLRELRYGKDGYFWADTVDGVNIVLLGQKDTEGRNRLQDKDADGIFYVKAFLEKGKAGGGYVEYRFAKLGEAQTHPKRSYVKLFEPFGWVVGTGYYLD